MKTTQRIWIKVVVGCQQDIWNVGFVVYVIKWLNDMDDVEIHMTFYSCFLVLATDQQGHLNRM